LIRRFRKTFVGFVFGIRTSAFESGSWSVWLLYFEFLGKFTAEQFIEFLFFFEHALVLLVVFGGEHTLVVAFALEFLFKLFDGVAFLSVQVEEVDVVFTQH